MMWAGNYFIPLLFQVVPVRGSWLEPHYINHCFHYFFFIFVFSSSSPSCSFSFYFGGLLFLRRRPFFLNCKTHTHQSKAWLRFFFSCWERRMVLELLRLLFNSKKFIKVSNIFSFRRF